MDSATQETLSKRWSKKPAANPRQRSKRVVSANRADQATFATSVSLTEDEKAALKALAEKRHVSSSDLLRQGLRKVLAEDPAVAPPSIGILDGVYGATIRDDVVALANALVALGFVVGVLEHHMTRRRREHARAMLADTMGLLQRVTGCAR